MNEYTTALPKTGHSSSVLPMETTTEIVPSNEHHLHQYSAVAKNPTTQVLETLQQIHENLKMYEMTYLRCIRDDVRFELSDTISVLVFEPL